MRPGCDRADLRSVRQLNVCGDAPAAKTKAAEMSALARLGNGASTAAAASAAPVAAAISNIAAPASSARPMT